MAGASLNDSGKMVDLMAPHRTHYRNLVDHAPDVREPVRDRDTRLPVACEGALAEDHGPFHFGAVVAEADGINHLARPFVVFGIECVYVADAAAHEQEDD